MGVVLSIYTVSVVGGGGGGGVTGSVKISACYPPILEYGLGLDG